MILCLLSLVPSLQALAQLENPLPYAATIKAGDIGEITWMVMASDASKAVDRRTRCRESCHRSHFNSLGIDPYDGSTYYQPVKLIRSQITGGQAAVNGKSLVFLDDFLSTLG